MMAFKIILATVAAIGSIGFSPYPNVTNPAVPETPVVKYYQQGSGFFINENGYIATAAHVLEGGNQNMVSIRYYGQILKAKVVAVDNQHDVAILKIDVNHNTRYFTLTEPVQYETAYILGFPAIDKFGLYVHQTEGEVVLDSPADDTFSIFAKACHGNSGGVVTNKSGDAIGILVYGFGDLTIMDGLCSYHSGARFVDNLKKLAENSNVKIHYSPTPSLITLDDSDLVTSIVDGNKVIFIQVAVTD